MPSDELATPAIACQTSPESASTSDEQPPIEFSTLMRLLHAASIINAKRMDGEVSIPRTALGEGQAEEEEDKATFTPLEAMAAILVQHGEVIATSYTSKIGAVVVTDSDTATSNAVKESDVPDSILPAEFLAEKVNHDPGVYSLSQRTPLNPWPSRAATLTTSGVEVPIDPHV